MIKNDEFYCTHDSNTKTSINWLSIGVISLQTIMFY